MSWEVSALLTQETHLPRPRRLPMVPAFKSFAGPAATVLSWDWKCLDRTVQVESSLRGILGL